MSITLRYADSRDEAATILNDAFVKVFTNFDKYDSDREFKPWLRRIIINTAINHYHSNSDQRKLNKVDFSENKLRSDERILSGISYDEIIEMVQKLSPAYRTVFNLYVIEGYKHREIAEMLNIAVGTSKSNLARAKENLQSILEKKMV